jgi:hypothetical protein
MSASPSLDSFGRRRSPAAVPGFAPGADLAARVLERLLEARDDPVALGRRDAPGDQVVVVQADAPGAERRYPPDPPRIEEIIQVMRCCGDGLHGDRARGLIVEALIQGAQERVIPLPPGPPPRRNDVCPCGSGVKYKRCPGSR